MKLLTVLVSAKVCRSGVSESVGGQLGEALASRDDGELILGRKLVR
jgi:hypothetical protein